MCIRDSCSGHGAVYIRGERGTAEPDPGGAPVSYTHLNVSAYVRPGGVLVYSTCTVLPEENGGVVSAFLDVHPDFAKEEFTLPGIGSCPGDVTLWPQRTGTDGFYICRMRRRG